MARVFIDFNVLVSPEDRTNLNNVRAKIQAAVNFGYQMVALNTVIEDVPVTSKKKKKDGTEQNLIPEPIKLDFDEAFDSRQNEGKRCKILNRITLIMSDPGQGHKLSIPAVKKYDIIAVQPTNEKMFQTICGSRDVDIIALNLNERMSFSVKRPSIKLALTHGIAFEISYVPLIKDRMSRRNILSYGQILVEMCPGKSILMSSGALRPIDLRGPYDVANLGLLFGMSQEQAKNAVSTNGRSLLLHAEARYSVRAVISVTPIAELELKDFWKVKVLKEAEEEAKGVTKIDPNKTTDTLNEANQSVVESPAKKRQTDFSKLIPEQ